VQLAVIALLLVAWGFEARAETLRVAAVFGTAIAEPWVGRIHDALLRMSDRSGISYRWSDEVAPDELGPTLRHYAEQGYELIVADSFNAEALAREVAGDFPHTAFLLGSGGGPVANVSVFDNWIHEPAYLAGMIAGGITAADHVGVVAALPIPEVNRLVNAFCQGAKEVNPGVRCQIGFIGGFFDPERARTEAMAQIEDGIDVIYAERLAAIEAAAECGIAAIGNLADQAPSAPDTVVTSVVWDFAPTLRYALDGIEAGTFVAEDLGRFSLMRHGGAALAAYGPWEDKLPEDLMRLVAERGQAILDGRFRVVIDESDPRAD
jgi:basic membrane lipoprotein Med (substrate-binding protein (PBP1-ABC) superfamily)